MCTDKIYIHIYCVFVCVHIHIHVRIYTYIYWVRSGLGVGHRHRHTHSHTDLRPDAGIVERAALARAPLFARPHDACIYECSMHMYACLYVSVCPLFIYVLVSFYFKFSLTRVDRVGAISSAEVRPLVLIVLRRSHFLVHIGHRLACPPYTHNHQGTCQRAHHHTHARACALELLCLARADAHRSIAAQNTPQLHLLSTTCIVR